ncbi:MAG: PepSY domain-containing protein [Actinomycetes bacterium]
MQRRTKIAIGIAAVAAAVAAGTGGAVASGVVDDDAEETPITGADLERASAAALEHTGGGRVTATELEDEESRYEVEVTLADGRQVDVQLDEAFAVVGSEGDDDSTEDGD